MTRLEIDLTCPSCGRINEVHQEVPGDPGIESGDVFLCWGCAEASVLTGGGILRPPDVDELAEIESEPSIIAARAAMVAAERPSDAVDALRRQS